MVRGGGLEPPHHFWRQDLNLVRLPISPPALIPAEDPHLLLSARHRLNQGPTDPKTHYPSELWHSASGKPTIVIIYQAKFAEGANFL